MNTGRRRKLKRATLAASGRGGGEKLTESSVGQPPRRSTRAGPRAGREEGVTEQRWRARPHLGEGRARAACTNTWLSAGTSSGPARRGNASSASDNSRLKRGLRSQGPGAPGNGGAETEHRARAQFPLGSPCLPLERDALQVVFFTHTQLHAKFSPSYYQWHQSLVAEASSKLCSFIF